jgi:hypothetical protein
MIDLIKVIYERLSPLAQTFLEEGLQATNFPYITFTFNPSTENFQREIFILEVNVWDNQKDTTALEELANDVNKALHRYKYYESGKIQTSVYRMNRGMVSDPDPTIRRRRLMFECKTYLKE